MDIGPAGCASYLWTILKSQLLHAKALLTVFESIVFESTDRCNLVTSLIFNKRILPNPAKHRAKRDAPNKNKPLL